MSETDEVWTDARIALMRDGWARGLSDTKIAKELGPNFTRNQVAGMIHRLRRNGDTGFPSRIVTRSAAEIEAAAAKAKRAREDRRTVVVKSPRAAPVYRPWLDAPAIEPEGGWQPKNDQRLGVVDLEPNHCRWPIGDPKTDADFHFCGDDKLPGQSYCTYHCRRAFAPPRPRTPFGGAPRVRPNYDPTAKFMDAKLLDPETEDA